MTKQAEGASRAYKDLEEKNKNVKEVGTIII